MNRIADAFANGKALIAFLTAGDPSAGKTVEYILAMERAGADLIELGIPFSDPIAEGADIQQADLRALRGGMTVPGVFDIVRAVREKSGIPLVLLTYLNPVYQLGYETFFACCEEAGVDGIIIPDLPLEEREEVEPAAKAHGVHLIPMAAPASRERLERIARQATGFVCVTIPKEAAVESETALSTLLTAIKAASPVPAAVDLDIRTPDQAQAIARLADGVMVGSAVVRLVEQYGENATEPLTAYVHSMKEAVRSSSI